jgi:hypothetical protein
MKLNASQIKTIEYYLLTWELKYKDFYDEILDHYCTDIENQMEAGFSFDDAFDKTNQVFSKYYYAQFIRFKEPIHHYGPKAFEAEYVDGYRKTFKAKLKNHFFNIFRTYQIGFLGALVMFFYYCFSNKIFLSTTLLMAILYLPSIIIFLVMLREQSKQGFAWSWKSLFFIPENDINHMRSKQFRNVKIGVLQEFFLLPITLMPAFVPSIMNANKTFDSYLSSELKTLILSLFFIYFGIVLKLLLESLNSWNLLKFK